MINIAILGYGTVGSGVFEIIRKNQDVIKRKSNRDINIKYVLDLKKFPNDPVESVLIQDYNKIIEDEDIKIIVEVMGGTEPAFSFVKQALLKGKNVVTSNKELVAKYGTELIALAEENSVNFLFEASVGGGIPIIRPLCSSLTADKITEVIGILNGTTNFILTEMVRKGKAFDEVLKAAQELGYAERNPEADVEGYDAGRKLAILSSLAFGKYTNYEDIYTEGITKISWQDMEYAKEIDSVIKLIGVSKLKDDGINALVAPFIISNDHPLSNIHGVFNAILVKGNMSGDTMYYGSGAGKLPTASAVVSDVIDATRHIDININIDWSEEKMKVNNIGDNISSFLIRIAYNNEKKLTEKVNEIFTGCKIVKIKDMDDELAIVVGKDLENNIYKKIEILSKDQSVKEIRQKMRVEV